MSDRHYKQPPVVDEAQAVKGLASPDPGVRAEVLLSAALSGLPRPFLEAAIRAALADAELSVRRTALTAAGHTARLHRALDPTLVREIEALAKEPGLAGPVSDALDDIEVFVRPKR